MLDHGSNIVHARAADRPSARNARHLAHLPVCSAEKAVLRFSADFFFENIDAKVDAVFTNMHLRPGYELADFVLRLATERAP